MKIKTCEKINILSENKSIYQQFIIIEKYWFIAQLENSSLSVWIKKFIWNFKKLVIILREIFIFSETN